MDYRACRWPSAFTERGHGSHTLQSSNNKQVKPGSDNTVITYSHFLPRIDLMPGFHPKSAHKLLYPILGSAPN